MKVKRLNILSEWNNKAPRDKYLVSRYVEMSPHRSRSKVDLLVGAAPNLARCYGR
jgi:hypothetical protein